MKVYGKNVAIETLKDNKKIFNQYYSGRFKSKWRVLN